MQKVLSMKLGLLVDTQKNDLMFAAIRVKILLCLTALSSQGIVAVQTVSSMGN